MLLLPKSLLAWGTPSFEPTLKAELCRADINALDLQQGLTSGNTALETGVQAMLISSEMREGFIRCRIGLFFSSVIAGCACADDPTPVNEYHEYCEAQLDIRMPTAEAILSIIE